MKEESIGKAVDKTKYKPTTNTWLFNKRIKSETTKKRNVNSADLAKKEARRAGEEHREDLEIKSEWGHDV